MNKQQELEIIEDIRNFSAFWYLKYNRKVEYDDIESAAFYWARNKLESLNDKKTVDIKRYRSYLKTCLSKELTKVVRSKIAKSAYYMPSEYFAYTMETIKDAIKAGDPKVIQQLEDHCTEKQRECIYIVISDEKLEVAAARLGRHVSAITNRAKEGLETLVLKNKNNFDA